LTHAILTDWRSAPISGKLRAALGFLEKLTLSPKTVGPEDVAALRVAGLNDPAIRDAIYVCVGFNIIARIADALAFTVPPPEVFASNVKPLLIFGYDILSGVQLRKIWRTWRPDRRRGDHIADDESLTTSEAMTDAYAGKLKRLTERVIFGPGSLDPEVRNVACVGGELPGVPGAYVQRVWQRAHEITNEDISALRQFGYSEDQIFELTVSAALGAGLVRLESALTALCYEHSPQSADIVANEDEDCLRMRKYGADSSMLATTATGNSANNIRRT
jgi:alkylhydroperoxidase family enzyme